MTRCEYLDAYHGELEKLLNHDEMRENADYSKWSEKYHCAHPNGACPFLDYTMHYIRDCVLRKVQSLATTAREQDA